MHPCSQASLISCSSVSIQCNVRKKNFSTLYHTLLVYYAKCKGFHPYMRLFSFGKLFCDLFCHVCICVYVDGHLNCTIQSSRWSHKPHPSQREEGSGHAATIELLPRQKLDVANQIRAICRSHLLSWSTITSQRI